LTCAGRRGDDARLPPALAREPFHRDGWVYEDKVDGWRILAYKASASA
jgi:hypothetical protein